MTPLGHLLVPRLFASLGYQQPSWWRHQMETFSALLAICAGNSPVTGEFPAQRPVTRSFNVFFDLRLNNRLSKQSWCWWFETLPRSLWRHNNDDIDYRSLRGIEKEANLSHSLLSSLNLLWDSHVMKQQYTWTKLLSFLYFVWTLTNWNKICPKFTFRK